MEKGSKENNFKGELYTKIPNQLLEALLQIKLHNYEIRILFAIARKTYGFNKSSDFINQKQLEKLTGITQAHISRTLKNLIEKKMIIKNGKQFSIQKDFKLWNIPEKEIIKNIPGEAYSIDLEEDKNIPGEAYKYTPRGIKNIPGEAYTKNIYKKTYTKNKESPKIPKTFSDDSLEIKLSNHLLKRIRENNPDHKEPNIKQWVKHMDYMLRIDKRSPEKIIEVIDWSQKDSFWFKNILSTEKLREKFDQLIMNMKDRGKNGKPGKHFENERDYTDEEQRAIDEKFYA